MSGAESGKKSGSLVTRFGQGKGKQGRRKQRKSTYLCQPLQHGSQHRPQSLCLLLQLLLQDHVQGCLAQGHGKVAAPKGVEVRMGEGLGDLRQGRKGGECPKMLSVISLKNTPRLTAIFLSSPFPSSNSLSYLLSGDDGREGKAVGDGLPQSDNVGDHA